MAHDAPADVLFIEGRLWTGSGHPCRVGGVAVRDGRIVAVGSASELRRMRGVRTRIVPIGEGCLLPAFQDAHVHPVWGGLATMACDLSGSELPEVWLTTLEQYASDHPDASLLHGEGWTAYPFGNRFPDRTLLDRVVPDRPVVLVSRDGHSTWINSAALRAAGIDRGTADPPGGRLERDGDGEPTGVLHEAANELAQRLVPEPDAAQVAEALRRGQAYLHGLGISAWLDAVVEPSADAAYLALAGRGELTGRATLALAWDRARGLEQLEELAARRAAIEAAGSGVRAGAVKVFVDGVIESSTAALLEPYADGSATDGAGCGASIYVPHELRRVCVAIDAAGFDVHAHAIGDRGVREALDALEAARAANGVRDARHAIAHLELVDAADVPRFAQHGVIADCQALWAVHDESDTILEPRLGRERLEARYPFGSLARAGTTLALGSDWNVSTADPLAIMAVAVARASNGGGRPLGPATERLSIEQALAAATEGSARVQRLEHLTGRIEVGMAADLVLLDGDPLVDGIRLDELRVLLTMVDGRVVHEDRALPG